MTQTIKVKFEPQLQAEFEKTCKELEITVSDAIELFAKQVVREQRIPFDSSIKTVREIQYDKATQEIQKMKDVIVKELNPIQIWLFGSFANKTFRESSDYDLYVVLPDGLSPEQLYRAVVKARIACGRADITKRSYDILTGCVSRFNKYKESSFIEGYVYRQGMLIYQQGEQKEKEEKINGTATG